MLHCTCMHAHKQSVPYQYHHASQKPNCPVIVFAPPVLSATQTNTQVTYMHSFLGDVTERSGPVWGAVGFHSAGHVGVVPLLRRKSASVLRSGHARAPNTNWLLIQHLAKGARPHQFRQVHTIWGHLDHDPQFISSVLCPRIRQSRLKVNVNSRGWGRGSEMGRGEDEKNETSVRAEGKTKCPIYARIHWKGCAHICGMEWYKFVSVQMESNGTGHSLNTNPDRSRLRALRMSTVRHKAWRPLHLASDVP